MATWLEDVTAALESIGSQGSHHAAMDFGVFEVSSSTLQGAKGPSIGHQFINYQNDVIAQSGSRGLMLS